MLRVRVMMNLRSYTNEALLEETQTFVGKEREATVGLIECLAEIEVRMLYAAMGFSSLWEFCTQYLGLSEGSAQRRISAMRLARKVPEVKEAISQGKLSLSNASKLERFFNHEQKNGRPTATEEKRRTIKQMEGLSQAECDKRLFEISPQFEMSQTETLKPVAKDQNLLKIILSDEAVENLNLLKGRLAHQFPNASIAELFEFLIKDKLNQIEAKMKMIETPANHDAAISSTAAAAVKAAALSAQSLPKAPRRAIPIGIRRSLWKRADGKCEFQTPEGKRCDSTRALEVDHITPVALGGTNDLSNLRLVCRCHNGYFAQETFSSQWMSQFMPRLRR